MAERREIDERDIDQLLKALTDRQIADLFGMSEVEVMQLRQSRQSKPPATRPD
jgi:K+-transporting ATPase c subunit